MTEKDIRQEFVLKKGYIFVVKGRELLYKERGSGCDGTHKSNHKSEQHSGLG